MTDGSAAPRLLTEEVPSCSYCCSWGVVGGACSVWKDADTEPNPSPSANTTNKGKWLADEVVGRPHWPSSWGWRRGGGWWRRRRRRAELNSGRFGRPAATAAGGGRSKVKFDNAALAPPTWTLRKCEGFAEDSG